MAKGFMGGICFLVVVDSYAIALIPSLSLPPFFCSLSFLSSRRLKRGDVRGGGNGMGG